MESGLDELLAGKFNMIFYEHYPEMKRLDIDEGLIAGYLCEDIDTDEIKRDSRRAVFASFAKQYCNESVIDELIRRAAPDRFVSDIRQDPLVEYIITCTDPFLERRFHKARPSVKLKHEYEPNIVAMLASSVYRGLFRNQKLLGLVGEAADAQDLRALVYIDYILKTTRSEEVKEILRTRYCLESKALQITGYALGKTELSQDGNGSIGKKGHERRYALHSYLLSMVS